MGTVNTDPERVQELLSRGVAEVIVEDDLKKKLKSGKKLRVKLGIDPTSPNIHLGRSIPLLKLRDFQELGHQVIFIVGDFTGVIGDTSDKENERPMLDQKTITQNMETYVVQAGKILDMKRVEVRYNSEWLEKLTYREIGEHANLFSVTDFIARDNIKRRLTEGTRVSLREVLYPLMQGYDSVAVRADVEIGGIDQKFNLLAGRALQEHFGQPPQDVLMNPMVLGLDGRKMSSSWGNTINLTLSPQDMYGKVMSMNDEEIVSYFTLCTRLPQKDMVPIKEQLQSGTNPRDIKMQLARELVTMYHNVDLAKEAEESFIQTFQKGEIPKDVVEVACKESETHADALVRTGVVASKSELKRLLRDGGVRDANTGEKLSELPKKVAAPLILKIGKRRFAKLL